jgi:hypothetical protein
MVVVMGEIVKTSKGGGEQQLQKLAHLVTWQRQWWQVCID